MGALRPGQRLDGTSYQVVREIGAGGMGVVYEIEHVRLKKRYVAKVIHDQIKNEDGATQRMEREAQVLAAISHPNVVQVHDVGTTTDGMSYFVMEKLEGVDLRQSMKKTGLTRLRSVEVVSDVLEALDYVHRRGIVHRDIKPENIFLAEQAQGVVTKVLDFGIVHIFDNDGHISQGRITKTGGFVGTLYYAAPEQMQGKTAGPPNDVYAAGLVLFELLAGKGPFDDDPGVGLSRCFKPAPLLTELVPTAPPELAAIIARALEQDPSVRPAAGALAVELRTIAANLRTRPGASEDEAIRAEVDDLLRHMAPVDHAPRPAAGRPPTIERTLTPHPAPEVTAAPTTPLMAGAPAGRSSGAVAVTLASPTGEPTPAPAAPVITMLGAAAAPVGFVPVDTVAPTEAAPQTPPLGTPPRISSPGAPSFPEGVPAHAVSAPPPSPRFPPETARGIGPDVAPPLFAAAMPMHPARFYDSAPGTPPGDVSTSPGVYATIDNQSIASTREPARTPWTAIALAGAALVLVAIVGVGWFVSRQHGTAATAAAATAVPPVSSAPNMNAPATTEAATATPAPPSANSAIKQLATATSAASITKPPARSTIVATPPAPPKVTPPAPRASSKPGADSDGYVKSL